MSVPRGLSIYKKQIRTERKEEPANKTDKECPETEEVLSLGRLLGESKCSFNPRNKTFSYLQESGFFSIITAVITKSISFLRRLHVNMRLCALKDHTG